jgi:hypothetical protein
MQSEASQWDLSMRSGAGEIIDDPRYPAVEDTINKWRGEADSMLTIAISNDPGTVNCSAAAKAAYGLIANALPTTISASGTPKEGATTGCEVGLVADLKVAIDDLSRGVKYCEVPWAPDSYFSGIAEHSGAAANPPAGTPAQQRTARNSCLAEFKAPQSGGTGHGRAVSHLLTTLQVIVYVETQKAAAAAK